MDVNHLRSEVQFPMRIKTWRGIVFRTWRVNGRRMYCTVLCVLAPEMIPSLNLGKCWDLWWGYLFLLYLFHIRLPDAWRRTIEIEMGGGESVCGWWTGELFSECAWLLIWGGFLMMMLLLLLGLAGEVTLWTCAHTSKCLLCFVSADE